MQVLFGLHYPAAKEVVAYLPPPAWAFLRAASAALLLAALVGALGQPRPRGGPVLLRFAGLALLGVALNQLLFTEGIARTTTGHSALINTAIPVLVLLLAVLLGRERPTGRRLLGIALTLAGVLVLIGPDQLERGAPLRGDLLTFANAASFSLFLVLGKPVLERERSLPATALLLALGALWLAPLGAPALARVDLAAVPPHVWALAAFIAVGPTIGAYALNTYALRRVESSLVALFVYLQPLIGDGLSVGLGREQPTIRLLVAGAVVFAGVFAALRAPP